MLFVWIIFSDYSVVVGENGIASEATVGRQWGDSGATVGRQWGDDKKHRPANLLLTISLL